MCTETYVMLMIQYITLCPHNRYPRVIQSTSWPVREMSSLRVGNPGVGISASCPV